MIEEDQLDSEQRFDYAHNLAEIQESNEIAALEERWGKLPEHWRKEMIKEKVDNRVQNFLRAHWGEYGYDESIELKWLRDGLTEHEVLEALHKALEEE
jgi:hypothetical protein